MMVSVKHLHCFVMNRRVVDTIVDAWSCAHRIDVPTSVRFELWRNLKFMPRFTDYVRAIDKFLTLHFTYED